MKKLILLTVRFFFFCMQIHARKIGIKFQNLEHFGLIYKKKLDLIGISEFKP